MQALPYSHKRFGRSAEWIPAMREVQHIVEEVTFSNDSFALSLAYINWETDAIVGIELIRNIGIALGTTFDGKIFVAVGKIFTVLFQLASS